MYFVYRNNTDNNNNNNNNNDSNNSNNNNNNSNNNITSLFKVIHMLSFAMINVIRSESASYHAVSLSVLQVLTQQWHIRINYYNNIFKTEVMNLAPKNWGYPTSVNTA